MPRRTTAVRVRSCHQSYLVRFLVFDGFTWQPKPVLVILPAVREPRHSPTNDLRGFGSWPGALPAPENAKALTMPVPDITDTEFSLLHAAALRPGYLLLMEDSALQNDFDGLIESLAARELIEPNPPETLSSTHCGYRLSVIGLLAVMRIANRHGLPAVIPHGAVVEIDARDRSSAEAEIMDIIRRLDTPTLDVALNQLRALQKLR